MGETPRERTQEQKFEEVKKRNFWLDVFKRLIREKPMGTVGGAIVLILFLSAVFANYLAPYGFNEIMLQYRLSPPSLKFILGTDHLGRDLLSRIIYGARISMYISLSVSALAIAVGALIGIPSGYWGGKADVIIQRFVDAWMAMPALFILLTFMSVLGPGLIQVILCLGIHTGIRDSRVVRSAVIGVKENVYVEAARSIGARTGRILMKHILPNVLAPMIILFTVNMGSAILTESTISFLGFGIPPPTPAWGLMLSEAGPRYMLLAPWMAIWPGVALSLVVYGINMLGDALRDLLDPRLRGGLGRYGRKVERKEPEKAKESPAQA